VARILVSDDDSTVGEVVAGYLERAGHAIRRAADGVEALSAVEFELPDLVVPAVTVVRHDSYRMGARAAELAFERLGSPELPARRILVPTELVVRGSGEVPPP